jgi:heat shock protein HtpX
MMWWRAKTAAMFIVMTAILLAVGLAVGLLLDIYIEDISSINALTIGLLAMLSLAVIFNLYAYFGSKRAALRANKAKIVTEAQEPRLYRIVRSVATKADVKMPEVGISELAMPNAFATGRSQKNAAVVVTRGLLNLLPDDELEGVIAHELAHIKNKDMLVMTVASTMAAVLTYLAMFARLSLFIRGGGRNSLYMILIAIAVSITVPIAAMLVRMSVSRSREYLADESGAKITNNPLALARALKNIESGVSAPMNDYSNSSYADLWISDPVRKKGLMTRMFSTHPPIDDRIEKLNALAVKQGQIRLQVDPFK